MNRLSLIAVLVGLTVSPAAENGKPPDDPATGRFSYYHSGDLVTLQASPVVAAALVHGIGKHQGTLTPPDGLEPDPRGDRPDLLQRGMSLFRIPNSFAPRGLDTPPPDAWQAALVSGLPAQPVFEHGAALRIPSNQVITGFPRETTLAEARRLLSGVWDDLGIRLLEKLRPGSFVCTLGKATSGRSMQASRKLTEVAGVLWAEPSFINIHQETPGGPPGDRSFPGTPLTLAQEQKLETKLLSRSLPIPERAPEGGVWFAAVDGHFEGDIYKWTIARDEGSNRILPEVVRDPTRESNRVVYMSGRGLAANTPPAPYRESAGSYLISPVFNLANYSEGFIELWFRAQFEDPVDAPRQVYDFGRVMLYDLGTNRTVYSYPIVPVGPTGDLTTEPGTVAGWRKLKFRIPVLLLPRPLQVRVHFTSDGVGGAAGLYVDDIRVLYDSGKGKDPGPDVAPSWAAGIQDQDAVVAILDDGVEAGHPDLAFWEPVSEESGSNGQPQIQMKLFPGEPVASEDNHGTACAGVVGAVANNGIGLAGVSPGALIIPLHRGLDDISIAQAIDAAVEYRADILVIPWGWTDAWPALITEAILDALVAGVTVVAAAGDGIYRPYSDAVDYPCVLSGSTPLICVGTSSIEGEPKGPASTDGMYWWSSARDRTGPDLMAPGTWMHATDRMGPKGYNDGSQSVPSGWTNEFAGTGASACYVGGVAAVMTRRDPLLQPEELKRLMLTAATEQGSGLADGSMLRQVDPNAAADAAAESAVARERSGPN